MTRAALFLLLFSTFAASAAPNIDIPHGELGNRVINFFYRDPRVKEFSVKTDTILGYRGFLTVAFREQPTARPTQAIWCSVPHYFDDPKSYTCRFWQSSRTDEILRQLIRYLNDKIDPEGNEVLTDGTNALECRRDQPCTYNGTSYR